MRIVPSNFLCGLALIYTTFASAEPGPPPPRVPPPSGLPIDGGVVLLIIAAIAYGLYKVYQLKIRKAL